jgi:hypothetical protein
VKQEITPPKISSEGEATEVCVLMPFYFDFLDEKSSALSEGSSNLRLEAGCE